MSGDTHTSITIPTAAPSHPGRRSSPPPSPAGLSLDWISSAQRPNPRSPRAHLPLTGSVLSRRLPGTQDPGQRRTDSGFGRLITPLITPPPNVPQPEKSPDSREAEPRTRRFRTLSRFLVFVVVCLRGCGGPQNATKQPVWTFCLVWMLLRPLPLSHPPPASLYTADNNDDVIRRLEMPGLS